MTTSSVSIDQALLDRRLLGAVLGDSATWRVWLAILAGAYGLPLDADGLATFRELTGRDPPATRPRELWFIAGRRSAKSRIAAALGVFTACFAGAHVKLSPGEVGRVMIIAPTMDQAQIVHDYARAFVEDSPALRKQIVDIRSDEIELRNRIVISTHPASARSLRGRTALAIILDEIAHFRAETSGQLSDVEVLHALLPMLATTNGSLIGISSPHMKQGILYDRFNAYYRKQNPDVLIVKGASLRLNPTLTPAIIEAAIRDDPYGNIAEWEAEFRADLASFIDIDTIRLCVDKNVHRRPFDMAHRYYAFADMSGGASDSATLAVAHRHGERTVIDTVVECKAPHVPQEVVADFARVLSDYRIRSVHGDQYAKQWVVGEFRRHDVSYQHFEQNRSEIYINALPLLQGGLAVLPDHGRLIAQLAGLERSPQRSGHDVVDHGRGGHDDIANAVCGALVLVSGKRSVAAHSAAAHGRDLPTHANVGYSDVKRTHASWRGGGGGVTKYRPGASVGNRDPFRIQAEREGREFRWRE